MNKSKIKLLLLLMAGLLVFASLPQAALAETTNSTTVVTWGSNANGQCNVPAELTDVTAITAGGYHTVALKADGTVVAWGYNNYGQCNVPVGLTDVRTIAAGVYHTVALKADGTVVAWGYNNVGQCNVPTDLTEVKAIAAGLNHTVALKKDGTVVAWGGNGDGQCDVPTGLTEVSAIAAGIYHSVALKADGTVVAWGYNNYGQCNVPADLTAVKAIAAGQSHTVALKADGTVVAWGNNYFGACNVPAGLTDATAIAAAGNHSVAQKADGTVVAWGNNVWGESNVPAGLSDVTAIAAGSVHTVTLVNNTVYDSYTVSFDAYGGTPVPDSQIIAAGQVATEPAAPVKAGFVFAGWYQDEEAFDFATPINGDMTLNARWLEPTDLIAQLSDEISENVANGNIKKLGNSLIAKCDNIDTKLDRGDTIAALNQLDAFISEVAAQKGKNINDATADQLIQNAQLIIATINYGVVK